MPPLQSVDRRYRLRCEDVNHGLETTHALSHDMS